MSYFLGNLTTVMPREQRLPTEHLKWLSAALARGELALLGPRPAFPDGHYIIRARDQADAERIAAEDPATIAGYTRCEVVEWDIRRGGVPPLPPEGRTYFICNLTTVVPREQRERTAHLEWLEAAHARGEL